MPPEQIVEMAFEILENKLSVMMNCVSKLEGFKEEDIQNFEPAFSSNVPGDSRKRGRPDASSWEEGYRLDTS